MLLQVCHLGRAIKYLDSSGRTREHKRTFDMVLFIENKPPLKLKSIIKISDWQTHSKSHLRIRTSRSLKKMKLCVCPEV